MEQHRDNRGRSKKTEISGRLRPVGWKKLIRTIKKAGRDCLLCSKMATLTDRVVLYKRMTASTVNSIAITKTSSFVPDRP